MADYLIHYGIKGQRWGIRRYQYADGSLTPAGRKRYSNDKGRAVRLMGMKVKELANRARTKITGKQYVDGCLNEGTGFARIQTSQVFERYPFYATYKKRDSEEYLGLFGKNLMNRAQREAEKAEKQAAASGSEADLIAAKDLRSKANSTKIYQLRLQSTKRLRIPSDENASDITAKLLKEDEFRNNLIDSIKDSKTKMPRPTQRILFNQALNALRKDPARLTASEKVAIYKAFNLSLVHHNAKEVAAQNRFYSELKKKGYNALLDYNDKEFSSYHAKRPVIIFDTDNIRMRAVTEANPAVVEKLYRKHNVERLVKEIPAQTVGLVSKFGQKTLSECHSYVNDKVDDYLGVSA